MRACNGTHIRNTFAAPRAHQPTHARHTKEGMWRTYSYRRRIGQPAQPQRPQQAAAQCSASVAGARIGCLGGARSPRDRPRLMPNISLLAARARINTEQPAVLHVARYRARTRTRGTSPILVPPPARGSPAAAAVVTEPRADGAEVRASTRTAHQSRPLKMAAAPAVCGTTIARYGRYSR